MKNSLDHILIAYALSSKQCILEISNKTTFEYFNSDFQWLYKAAMEHFQNPKFKEIPTRNVIKEYLSKNYSKSPMILRGIKLFDDIAGVKLDPAEFTWYLDKLKTRYNDSVQKSCIKELSGVIRAGKEDRIEKGNDLLRKSVSVTDSINKQDTYNEGPLNESAKDRALLYRAVEENPEIAKGISTGFSDFDRITNGLHPGELILVGGPTSTGKSIVMHNMAISAFLGDYNPLEVAPEEDKTFGGVNVLYFSLEMPKENQERRIDACMAGVLYNSIRDGVLTAEEKGKYLNVLKFQAKYKRKFHIVDMARGATMRDIEIKHKEIEEKCGMKFGLTVIDYLGLMRPSVVQSQDWLSLGFISAEAHEYARAMKIPVISGVQVNRPKDPTKEEHSTNRVARSDMIPTNANIILQIGWRGEDEHTRLDMPMYFIKNRDGEKTSFTLMKNFACMQVKDLVDESFGEEDDDDDDII